MSAQLGSNAYWIDPKGKILELGVESHIRQVINSPESFHTSLKAIKAEYDKHGEVLGTEGTARENIIKEILTRGFIRVRLYRNRYWSITVDRLTPKTRQIITGWAEKVKDVRGAGPYMPVRIVELRAGRVHKHHDVSGLINNGLLEAAESAYDVEIVESVKELGLFDRVKSALGD